MDDMNGECVVSMCAVNAFHNILCWVLWVVYISIQIDELYFLLSSMLIDYFFRSIHIFFWKLKFHISIHVNASAPLYCMNHKSIEFDWWRRELGAWIMREQRERSNNGYSNILIELNIYYLSWMSLTFFDAQVRPNSSARDLLVVMSWTPQWTSQQRINLWWFYIVGKDQHRQSN